MPINPYQEIPKEKLLLYRTKFNDLTKRTYNHWYWLGPMTGWGYGQWKHAGAHVWSYALYIGVVDRDNEVHHICSTKDCVNPKHLQQVSHKLNVQFGMGHYIQDGVRYCKRGHAMVGHNLQLRKNRTRYGCRACNLLTSP